MAVAPRVVDGAFGDLLAAAGGYRIQALDAVRRIEPQIVVGVYQEFLSTSGQCRVYVDGGA